MAMSKDMRTIYPARAILIYLVIIELFFKALLVLDTSVNFLPRTALAGWLRSLGTGLLDQSSGFIVPVVWTMGTLTMIYSVVTSAMGAPSEWAASFLTALMSLQNKYTANEALYLMVLSWFCYRIVKDRNAVAWKILMIISVFSVVAALQISLTDIYWFFFRDREGHGSSLNAMTEGANLIAQVTGAAIKIVLVAYVYKNRNKTASVS